GLVIANDLDKVDHLDFCDWLRRHGASEESVTCCIVRTLIYDLGFAYEDGDPYRPMCGAGTALRGVFRELLTYRGSIIWKMNGAMGDVVLAPIYELLCKRGVTLRFNWELKKICLESLDGGVSAPGRTAVRSLEFDVSDDPQPPGRERLQPWNIL